MWPPLSRHVTTFFESRDGFELIYVRFHPRVGPLLLSHNRNGNFSFSASFSSTVQDLYIDYAYFWRWYSLLHWHYIDLPFLAHTLVDKSMESSGSPCVSEDRSNTSAEAINVVDYCSLTTILKVLPFLFSFLCSWQVHIHGMPVTMVCSPA
jgi:hypothetical protein